MKMKPGAHVHLSWNWKGRFPKEHCAVYIDDERRRVMFHSRSLATTIAACQQLNGYPVDGLMESYDEQVDLDKSINWKLNDVWVDRLMKEAKAKEKKDYQAWRQAQK